MNTQIGKDIVIKNVRIENGCLVDMEVSGCPSRSGKVRKIFDLGEELLFIATDRISAFDVILPTPIARKGEVLTGLSKFWFENTTNIVPNAMISTDIDEICIRIGNTGFDSLLVGRSMLMRKCKPLAIECIVRGYLAGSGWKEYKKSETVCGILLPPGLVESSKLPEPIFTPSTKAEAGHDENITFGRATDIVGQLVAEQARDYSIAMYKFARDYAADRGIIIADTKFEFGLNDDNKLVLIDEVLTPDSSRFWPAEQYKPGGPQMSFDKQFVRDYLEVLCRDGKWDKTEKNIPVLPDGVVLETTRKYVEALEWLVSWPI